MTTSRSLADGIGREPDFNLEEWTRSLDKHGLSSMPQADSARGPNRKAFIREEIERWISRGSHKAANAASLLKNNLTPVFLSARLRNPAFCSISKGLDRWQQSSSAAEQFTLQAVEENRRWYEDRGVKDGQWASCLWHFVRIFRFEPRFAGWEQPKHVADLIERELCAQLDEEEPSTTK